jgi:hypothetical protein
MHGLALGAHNADGHISWSLRGHSHHTHHSQRSERSGHHDRSAANQAQGNSFVDGGAAQGSIKQAVVNQIRVTLSQRFDLQQTSVSIAGATVDEQAGNDLAGAVSSALNSLNGTAPTDAVAAVNDAAGAAIQQTVQALPAGTNADGSSTLDAAISQISDQLQSLFSAYLANSDTVQRGSSMTVTGAKLISNAKGELQIHTQEGDTVTLSFASKNGVSVQNLQAGDGSIQLSGSDIQAFTSSRVTISVQGNLNADELQAVQDLVGQVNQLANGFFGGDANAALSQSASLNFDSSQLTDYSLHLALKQTFAAYGLSLQLPPVTNTNQASVPALDGGTAAVAASPLIGVTPPPADSGTGTMPAGDISTTTIAPVAANDGAPATTKTSLAG